jgi:hypothetical protein
VKKRCQDRFNGDKKMKTRLGLYKKKKALVERSMILFELLKMRL